MGNLELREYLFGPLFIVPGLGMLHAVEQLLQPVGVVGLQGPFVVGDEAHRFVIGLEAGPDDCQLGSVRGRLFQIAYPQSVAAGDLPVVVILLPGQDIEERGFARSVFGNESHAVALADTQRYVFEQDAVAKRFGKILYL